MIIPRDDPRWPAFQYWAKDNLQNLMLSAYWECWKTAFLAGYERGQQDEYKAAQNKRVDHSTPTPEDVPD